MLGDKEWKELLWERYAETVAMAAYRQSEPAPYDQWAREATWLDFVRLARLVLALPPFALKDWATANPVPSVNGSGYHGTILARRLINALVMVNQILLSMKKWNGEAAVVTKRYLLHGRRSPLLAEARIYIYEWLLAAAELDKRDRSAKIVSVG
jgi:hypothetical protein